MKIDTLIIDCGFTNEEALVLRKLYSEIKEKGVLISFKYDYYIDCAKFKPKERIILLRSCDSFVTIVHELLHAKLIFIYDYPDFIEINKLKGKRKLCFFSQLIVDVTNDLHHFIFYKEFVLLTSKHSNVSFLCNEEELLSRRDTGLCDYSSRVCRNDRDRALLLIEFYNKSYISFKYWELLNNDKSCDLEKLHFLNPMLIEPFTNLFTNVLNSYLDKAKIIAAYIKFFDDIEKLA